MERARASPMLLGSSQVLELWGNSLQLVDPVVLQLVVWSAGFVTPANDVRVFGIWNPVRIEGQGLVVHHGCWANAPANRRAWSFRVKVPGGNFPERLCRQFT